MTQDFSNDLGGSAPTKEPLHPAPVSLAEVSAEESANSEGGATRPIEEVPRPAGEPPLPAPAPLSSPAPIDQPRRSHRWRWVASLAGVVATDMMIQIVFSAVGMMLIELAAQAGVLPRAQAAALIDSLTPIVVLTQVWCESRRCGPGGATLREAPLFRARNRFPRSSSVWGPSPVWRCWEWAFSSCWAWRSR